MKQSLNFKIAKKETSDESLRILKNQIEAKVNSKKLREDFENVQKILITSYIIMNFADKNIPLKEFLNNFEKRLIDAVLLITRGNQRRAAHILGVKEKTLSEKIKRFKLNKLELYVHDSHIYSFEEINSLFS